MKTGRTGLFLMHAVLIGVLSASANESRKDILIADFEGDSYGAWKSEGAAFGPGPAQGSLPNQQKVSGYLGNGLVNSFHEADYSTGVLTGPPFIIERNRINFLIGGGGYAGETCMNLLVGGKAVRTATGPNVQSSGGSETLAWQSWDVEEFAGQPARIEIVDRRAGGWWGHINADHIVQSDSPAVIAFEKKLTVDKKYLLVPVKNGDSMKAGQTFQLLKNGEIVREFRVLLPDNGTKADWTAFYPVDEFAGESILLKSRDALLSQYADAAGQITISDTIPDGNSDYSLPYRNQFHLSTRRGWNNDVNGLVFNNGTCNLYYQYNPFGICWDNMHWGHAVSTDLVHWVEHDIVLYQNSLTDMMWSGGGFMDTENTSGVSKDGRIPQFAAFTSTGRGECLAYSFDNGMTFTELAKNPVVKHTGRDPKIIWYQPDQKWVMVLFDYTDKVLDPPPLSSTPQSKLRNSVAFYSSKNLSDWTFEGRFVHPDRCALHECPELFEIPVEGRPGETRWILYGVENRYFVGHFDGHRFTDDSGPIPGQLGIAYAAQMISDAPEHRRIQIAQAMGGVYTNRWPDQRFIQGFLLPVDVTLHETPDGLRLFYYPVKEIDALRTGQIGSLTYPSVQEAEALLKTCAGKLLDVLFNYRLSDGAKLGITLNGQTVSVNKSGTLRIISDRTITEVFINEGEKAISYRRSEDIFDDTSCRIHLTGTGQIKQLSVYEMKSIWIKN
jgi:fructan beta-fructosidase